MEKILVFGHKNPDTDAICSSLVMADLQTKIRGEEVISCRLGNLNEETKYALRLIPLGGFISMEGEEELSDKEGSFSIRKETISGLIFPNEMKFLPFSKADISNEFIMWLPIHSWWFMNFY